MTTKHQVIAAHRAHPDWTARDISDALGCVPGYVNATARRNGLTLPKAVSRRATARPTIRMSDAIMQALDAPAAQRGLTVSDLARRVIETVARENMVDAVLDDREAA